MSGFLKYLWISVIIRSPINQFLTIVLSRISAEKVAQFPCVGYWPKIDNPRTFNEKVAHRKFFTDDDRFTIVSDKHAVREYVREKVGEEVLNPIYHVTNDPSSIPFDALPSEFAIKSTHGQGQIILVKGENSPDLDRIRSQCYEWLNTEFGKRNGEYWYTRIQPKIMVEELMKDPEHEVPLDYKFFVFHGQVEYIQVNINRFSDLTERFYDPEWNALDFTHAYEKGPAVEKPANLDDMISIAEKLGEEFDFARVDLYQMDNQVIFGEITLAPGSGYLWFQPKKWDEKLGALW